MNPLIDFSQLKITFLVGTLGQGGAEQQLVYILRTLREQGAQVRALCLTEGEYWETPLRDLGVPVTWVGQLASRLGRLRKIIAELQTDRPMILQSQHFYTNLYAALAARALGIREIGAMRCDGASEVAEHGRALGWLSLHLPRRLAVNSQGAIQFAEQHGVSSDRLFLLPNVIDHTRFQTPPRDGSPVVRLLTAGRLEPQKRMDRFLRMLAQLKTSATQPFKAVIAGDGALRSSLQEQAA
ncbi:MAG: glycosyltransferase, partial [Acidobacteria bacterium]|nr:glycosyltransferase [Acidobacteriota bacterium]